MNKFLTEKREIFYIFPTANNKLAQFILFVGKGQKHALKIKNNALTLDAIDLKILEALQEDARQTYTALGKRLGVAHSTVYDRIKRIERHGIIMKYTAIIDAEKAGAKNITAIMTVFTNPKESERVAEKLCEAPQVLEVYTSLSEELLIIAKVIAENQESLHEFIASSVAPLSGVLRIRTSIITKKFKETQFSIANNPKNFKFIRETDNKMGESKK